MESRWYWLGNRNYAMIQWFYMIQCNDAMRYDAMWYDAIWFNAMINDAMIQWCNHIFAQKCILFFSIHLVFRCLMELLIVVSTTLDALLKTYSLIVSSDWSLRQAMDFCWFVCSYRIGARSFAACMFIISGSHHCQPTIEFFDEFSLRPQRRPEAGGGSPWRPSSGGCWSGER